MVGLFRRVREGLSGSSSHPPRAEEAGPHQATTTAQHTGRPTDVSQRPLDARSSPRDEDYELQQALEASELEAALAQSRQAAEQDLYTRSRSPARNELQSAASDDEELKAAMALSEAEAKHAAKGKGIMRRTPTEEDMERALQESAKLAKPSPKGKQHHHASTHHQHSQAGASSHQDEDADLARALQESAQLGSLSSEAAAAPSTQAPATGSRQHQQQASGSSSSSRPSAPIMPSPAAASHIQHSPFPSPAASTSTAYSQPGSSSSSAATQQAGTSSVRYPDIYQPHHHSTSVSAAPPGAPGPRNSPGRQQLQQQGHSSTNSSANQPTGSGQQQPSGSDGLYIDGHHGSANLQSMLSADEAFARAIQQQELMQVAADSSNPPGPPVRTSQPPQQALSHQSPPSRQPQQQSQPPASSQRAAGNAAYQPGTCAGCGRSLTNLFGGGQWIKLAGRSWHPACLRCAGCGEAIGAGVGVGTGKDDNLPYHMSCYEHKYNPHCSVCRQVMQAGKDGMIRFGTHAFWNEKFCQKHWQDGTLQCCACARHCPQGDQWVTELDGRTICLECLSSIVRDTSDAQPLYDQVLGFYRRLGMALPEKPPLMLVEAGALNEAEEREGRSGSGHSHGPVFHTRGLTLTAEYRAVRQVITREGRVLTQPVDLSARDRFEVTAILVLYGLPWLLTGSILAHECMHAWLRLRGVTRLPLETEEGLCQLMALLWLEAQDLSKKQGSWEEKLASYFAQQIRTDPSAVYGEGFRAALECFQNCSGNLPALISHIERTGRFPV